MKKETLEEAAERYANDWEEMHSTLDSENMTLIAVSKIDFIAGAKWQAERMYSEEEVLKLLISCKERFGGSDLDDYVDDAKVIKWFEQLKKK